MTPGRWLGALSLLLLLSSCRGKSSGGGTDTSSAARAPSATAAPNAASQPIALTVGSPTIERARQLSGLTQDLKLAWWDINEYHDVQMLLNDTHDGYGPVAKIWFVPEAASFTHVKQFASLGPAGVTVALVTVWPGTLPKSYTDLGLQNGDNCVILAHDKSGSPINGWSAYVVPPQDGKCPRHDPNAPNPNSLQVRGTQAGGNTIDDYPAVARFDEDADERPLLGVRCARAWCEIGPAGFRYRNPGNGAGGPQNAVKGWHDEQRLAIPNGSGGLVPSALRATVTPISKLDETDESDFPTFKSVATIWLPEDPPAGSKYESKWKLKKGENDVQMKWDGTNWQAQLIPAGARTPIPLTVTPDSHAGTTSVVPGTARWKWKPDDESVWIRCGQNCCDLEAK